MSLTLSSLALCTILNLYQRKKRVIQKRKNVYLPLADTNSLGDLSAVSFVVHQKKLEIFFVANQEFLESVWKQVSSLVVLLATNLWHFLRTLHSSSGEAINTTHLSVRIGL